MTTTTNPPTEIGRRVLAYFQTNPAPSVREIVRECNISSTSVVNYWLRRYAREGVLTVAHKRAAARRYRLACATTDTLPDAARQAVRLSVDYGGAYVAVKREAWDALRKVVQVE